MLYTGGPRPYGYEGLGELFVFLFFGVVAVVGSYYVQTEDLHWEAFALSVPVGLLAAAILVVNNVRDVDTDRRAGKRTLAVKLGRERARALFVAMLVLAFASPLVIAAAGGLSWWLVLHALAWPLAPPLIRDRPHAHRRPGAQRRARRHRAAAGRVLAAARRRHPALVRRSLLRLSIPLRDPFVTAGGVVTARELVVLRLEDDDGVVGFGEAAPVRALRRRDARARRGGARAAAPGGAPPQARAAEEIARLDLEARDGGAPARRAAQGRPRREPDAPGRPARGGGGARAARGCATATPASR